MNREQGRTAPGPEIKKPRRTQQGETAGPEQRRGRVHATGAMRELWYEASGFSFASFGSLPSKHPLIITTSVPVSIVDSENCAIQGIGAQ